MGAILQLKQYNLVFLRDQISVLYFSLIYVNVIFNIFDFPPVLYADNTCLYVKASKEKDLETLMNREVEIANRWVLANKLTINATKSSALVITPGAKTATQKPKISCDGLPIAVNSNVKYLGLWID